MARKPAESTVPTNESVAKSVDRSEHPEYLPGSRVKVDMLHIPGQSATCEATVERTAGGSRHLLVQFGAGKATWISDARVVNG